MTDIFGPGSNATNVATARPADTRVMGATDTWWKDCSSPSNNDGTRVPAAVLNNIVANLRAISRGAGIPDDPVADDLIRKAILAEVQKQRGNFIAASGTANALTIAPDPAFTALTDLIGVPLRIKTGASANTGAAVLSVNGLAALDIQRTDGTPVVAGDLPANTVVEVIGFSTTAVRLSAAAPSQMKSTSSVGSIEMFLSTTAPPKRITSNGALISRTLYADLWAYAQACGNLAATEVGKLPAQFGPGDGATTFSVPDLRGLFPRALDLGAGFDTGRTLGTRQAAYLPQIPNSGWGTSGSSLSSSQAVGAGTLVVGSGAGEYSETLESLRSSGNYLTVSPGDTRPVNFPAVFYIRYAD